MKNEDVIAAFAYKEVAKSATLTSTGQVLKSYDLVIAERLEPHEAEVSSGIVVYWRFKKPDGSYSATTRHHLSKLVKYLGTNRISHTIIRNEEEMP